MTIEWLAGNRLRGTTAERPSASLQSPSVGGWVELGRTTLGSAGDTISVSGLSNKRYYHVFCDWKGTVAGDDAELRFNADSGSNYAVRHSTDGGADGTATSQTAIIDNFGGGAKPSLFSVYVANLAGKEKLVQKQYVYQNTAGAGTAPRRQEMVGKWANTADSIDEISIHQTGSGDYTVGSEVVVLGWDPADTHTTNFWEELASVELGSANANISSGTITAKKYLWIQAWFNCGSANDIRITFNSDSGNNYSHRMQQNGGGDVTYTSQDDLRVNYSTTASPTFVNLFMINNASNEKLITGHMTNTGGSGAGTAPDRRIEFVGKWANTSNQITSMNFYRGDGLNDYNSGTILKVWGAD